MGDKRYPLWFDATLLLVAGAMFFGMLALGNWQVERRTWKLELIENVNARAFADPVPAPLGDAPEYLRVTVAGTYVGDQNLRVKAVTDLGPGFWIMTPLITSNTVFWINRGFVPSGRDAVEWTTPIGAVTVTGLVRLDQPGGTMMERNQPDTGRWVSADLAAMTQAAGLATAQTTYFIDAEATDIPWPRGGMTRLSFRNTHLVYAVTWYAMAALFLAAMVYVVRNRLTTSDDA